MNILDAVLSRAGARKYSDKPVPDTLIRDLLEDAFSSEEPRTSICHFIVIDERHLLDVLFKLSPYSGLLANSTTALLICADLSVNKARDYWIHSCSAITENVLISAQAKGLHAVWLGIFPREDRVEECRKLLLIPGKIIPFSLVPLGYAEEEKTEIRAFPARRIHYNKW